MNFSFFFSIDHSSRCYKPNPIHNHLNQFFSSVKMIFRASNAFGIVLQDFKWQPIINESVYGVYKSWLSASAARRPNVIIMASATVCVSRGHGMCVKGPRYVCRGATVCVSWCLVMCVVVPRYVCQGATVCVSWCLVMCVVVPRYVCQGATVCVSRGHGMCVKRPRYVCHGATVCVSWCHGMCVTITRGHSWIPVSARDPSISPSMTGIKPCFRNVFTNKLKQCSY